MRQYTEEMITDIKAVMNSKMSDQDKLFTIEMYLKGWWSHEQVTRLIDSTRRV